MDGCGLCAKKRQRPRERNPHKICTLCGNEIHDTESYHADGSGARHMACESEQLKREARQNE
jgi:hypothetical protein